VHKVRPIATDVARSMVCVFVCVFGTRVSCAKTAELIKMPFAGRTHGSKEPCVRWGSRLDEFVHSWNSARLRCAFLPYLLWTFVISLVGCWLRGTVVERRFVSSELSLSYARPAADG